LFLILKEPLDQEMIKGVNLLKIYFKKSIFNGEGVFNSPKVCCDNWLIMFYFSCLNFDFWNLYLYYRLIQSVFCISGIFHKDFSWILLIGPEHRSDVFSKLLLKFKFFLLLNHIFFIQIATDACLSKDIGGSATFELTQQIF
jgi:hypothetical protein